MMTNFTLLESEYLKIPDILLSMVSGFVESVEYKKLNETERMLPGIVAAAFTSYFVTLLSKDNKEHSESNERAISSAFEAIEKLSNSHDGQVKVLIEEEIFENVRASKSVWDQIELRLGTHSQIMFARWNKKKI